MERRDSGSGAAAGGSGGWSVAGLAMALVLAAACASEAGGAASSAEPSSAASASAAVVASASGSHGPAPSSTHALATSAIATTANASTAAATTAVAAIPEGMVVVTEGAFVMGGESPENTPRHEVIVARFLMDTTEVTVEAYQACVKDGACKPMQKDNPFCNALFPDRAKHPANCIDWNDANAFCARAKKRLPTEQEWEYAARGGDQRLYAWGNEDPDTTRSCYMHNGGSCEVGTHPAAGFGLHDMTGNVWEWTSSWFGPYPQEPKEGFFKVYRGGSWSRRFSKWMRNDLRNRYKVDEQSASVGFRCALDVGPRTCPKDTEAKGDVCVRTGGAPPCPAGEAFVDGSCRKSGGPVASGGPHPVGTSVIGPAAASGTPSVTPPEEQTPVRSRSPNFDADCQKHYPGMPTAYRWSGGTFQAREPLIRGAGCKKRDVGVGWSSACCP